jgi:hypothetical protein
MTEQEYIDQATKFMQHESRFELKPFPCLQDDSGHGYDEHYIYHVAWAVQKIKEISPKLHIDIGSSLHLSTCAAALVPTLFLDFRKPNIFVNNLDVGQFDLTKDSLDPVESVSCCHVVEHIGLGRYGDTLDNEGDLKAIQNLKRIAANHLLFVVPVGKPVVQFNAHRVYSPVYIRNLFSEYDCEFYLIPNNGTPPKITEVTELDLPYACGCFHFKKRLASM